MNDPCTEAMSDPYTHGLNLLTSISTLNYEEFILNLLWLSSARIFFHSNYRPSYYNKTTSFWRKLTLKRDDIIKNITIFIKTVPTRERNSGGNEKIKCNECEACYNRQTRQFLYEPKSYDENKKLWRLFFGIVKESSSTFWERVKLSPVIMYHYWNNWKPICKKIVHYWLIKSPSLSRKRTAHSWLFIILPTLQICLPNTTTENKYGWRERDVNQISM